MESQTKDSGHVHGQLEDSDKAPNPEGRKRHRPDCIMFGVGIAFIAVLMAAVFGLGYWRGWDAPSGYYHNTSLTSKDRFLPEPTENDPYSYVRGRSGRPDISGVWYYWRNKPEAATVATRVFVWLMYALHQVSIWVLMYLAQVNQIQTKQPKVSTNLNKYNWISFGLNAFFHVMHLVKTHVTYDGIAPDVHIVSSQCSVIMLTMVILLLEYNERGFFLGWPVKKYHKGKISRKLTLSHKPIYYVRKYHGYAFAWGSIYTFWYHPMENTYGHALGFVHTWILMLQGSLMFTKVHVNRWWRLVLESWVLLHGSLVAVQTGNPDLGRSLWPMFFFGFLWVFLFNQIYILDFWYKIPDWVRVFPPAIYVAVTLGGYSAIPDAQGRYWVRIQEIIRIPAVYYISFILMWAFMLLCVFIDKKIYAKKRSSEASSATKIGHLVISLLLFILMVAISIALEVTVAPINMFVLMVLLVIIFSLLSGLAFILLSHAMPQYKLKVQPELGSLSSMDSDGASSLPEKAADPSQPQKMADTTNSENGVPQINGDLQSSKL